MKTTTQILPGVTAIGWIESRHLQARVNLAAICGMAVPILTDINGINFFDTPTCELARKKEGAATSETAMLKFKTYIRLPNRKKIAFIVTDANGDTYLIGAAEPPFPSVEATRTLGSPSGDPAGIEYEIKHTALRSLIPCVC